MREGAPESRDGPIVVYDGVCVFCSRSMRFIAAHDRSGAVRFAAMQNGTGADLMRANGLDPLSPDSFLVLDGNEALTGAAAVLRILRFLRPPWRWFRVLRVLPRPLLDWAYRRFARNRYRLFGRAEQCLLPTPRLRSRFVDL